MLNVVSVPIYIDTQYMFYKNNKIMESVHKGKLKHRKGKIYRCSTSFYRKLKILKTEDINGTVKKHFLVVKPLLLSESEIQNNLQTKAALPSVVVTIVYKLKRKLMIWIHILQKITLIFIMNTILSFHKFYYQNNYEHGIILIE